MDFRVTVKTYTGAIKTIEVKDMPDEKAARAEAIAISFGQVVSVERLDKEETPQEKKKKRRGQIQEVERPLKPGETETIITGYNNNPLALFTNLDIF